LSRHRGLKLILPVFLATTLKHSRPVLFVLEKKAWNSPWDFRESVIAEHGIAFAESGRREQGLGRWVTFTHLRT
jgi:hypothetical protein